jgi:hypothetical protein
MGEKLSKVMAWITDADWKTWIGHAMLGATIVLVGYNMGVGFDGVIFGALAAFVYREVSDLIAWVGKPYPKRSLGAKLRDGFIDLWAPLVGAGLLALILY